MANEETGRTGKASGQHAARHDESDDAETMEFSHDADDRTTQMPVDRKPATSRGQSPAAGKAGGGEVLTTGYLLGKRFQIVRHVHSGGMSHIYKAVDRRISSYTRTAFVAVKVLRSQLAERSETRDSLRREMARVRHLSHANIISVYDFYEEDGRLFLVMEWLDGESVQDLLLRTRGKRLDEKFAWRVIDDTAKALRYAHDHNVVHADINPANIFITDTQVIKLLDFGLARLHQDDQLTGSSDTVWATRRYASPEVLAGQPASFQDDVFSLGCVAYRLLSGKHAFGGQSAGEARRKGTAPPPIADLDKDKWQHLARSLAFERASRPDSVDGFRTAAAELPATAAPSPPPAKPARPEPPQKSAPVSAPRRSSGRRSRRSRRRPYQWAAAAVVLMLALLIPWQLARTPDPVVPQAPERTAAQQDDGSRSLPASGPDVDADPAAASLSAADDAEAAIDEPVMAEREAGDGADSLSPTEQLLERAAGAMAAERYVGAGDDDARSLFRQARSLDPDNSTAADGLRTISDVFVEDARSRMDAGEVADAYAALESAFNTDPDNPAATELREQFRTAGERRLADAESAVAAGNVPEANRLLDGAALFPDIDRQRIDELRQRADAGNRLYSDLALLNEHMAASRLVAPPGENALDVALRLRSRFGDHPRYIGAADRLGDRLVTEAVAAARGGRYPVAEAYLSALDALGIMATEAAAVRSLIADRRDAGLDEPDDPVSSQPEAAPAVDTAGYPIDTGMPDAAMDDFMPFSELRLERYVAPSFPRLARYTEKSGFVELRFKVLPDGTTRDIRVVNAEPGDLFITSAEQAVSSWEFERRDRVVNSQVKLSFEYDEAGVTY